MTDLDLTKLREIAEAAMTTLGPWSEYILAFDPPTVIALIDEVERLRAQVDEVAERAWDQAVGSIQYEDGSPVEIAFVTNPYRIKAGDSDE